MAHPLRMVHAQLAPYNRMATTASEAGLLAFAQGEEVLVFRPTKGEGLGEPLCRVQRGHDWAGLGAFGSGSASHLWFQVPRWHSPMVIVNTANNTCTEVWAITRNEPRKYVLHIAVAGTALAVVYTCMDPNNNVLKMFRGDGATTWDTQPVWTCSQTMRAESLRFTHSARHLAVVHANPCNGLYGVALVEASTGVWAGELLPRSQLWCEDTLGWCKDALEMADGRWLVSAGQKGIDEHKPGIFVWDPASNRMQRVHTRSAYIANMCLVPDLGLVVCAAKGDENTFVLTTPLEAAVLAAPRRYAWVCAVARMRARRTCTRMAGTVHKCGRH